MDNANVAESETDQGWIGWIQIAGIAAVIGLALFITLLLAMNGGSEPGIAPERAATPVHVIEPQLTDHTVSLELTGSVTPPANVTLTPQVGGRVIELSPNVRAGAQFEAGTTLFAIDPRDYELAVSRAGAAVADAQSALDQLEAESEINRAEWAREYPGREITPLAAREPQLRAAQARLTSARADLAQARLNLERTRIQMPFDGRVIESRIEAGQLVSAGQSYGTVYDLTGLEIVVPIPPSDLARLQGAVGRTLTIQPHDSQTRFEGQVVREGAQFNARTRFVDLYIHPDTLQDLRPGQFVEVTITGPDMTDVYALPGTALIGLDKVRLVQNGRIEEVQVEVLDQTAEHVITTPFDTAEGLIITPVPDNALGRSVQILSRGTE